MRLAVLAALLATAAMPASASAQPAPPSEAPPAAKRVCARYRVAQTPGGPAARCIAHRTEVLGSSTAGATAPPVGAESTPPPAPPGGSAHPGPATATSRATGPAPAAAEGGRSPAPAPDPGGGGDGDGTLIAIVAGCAVLAAALLALAGRPLFRRAGLRA